MPSALSRIAGGIALLMPLAACGARDDAPQAVAAAPAPTAQAESTLQSAAGAFGLTEIARGLAHPWAVAPLPEGGFLVTERPGRLRIVRLPCVQPLPSGISPAIALLERIRSTISGMAKTPIPTTTSGMPS